MVKPKARAARSQPLSSALPASPRASTSRYAGVSSIERRIHMPTGPRMPPRRKGTRQPQASIVAGSRSVFMSAATPEPRRSPATTLVCWKLPYQPRFPLGAHSTM